MSKTIVPAQPCNMVPVEGPHDDELPRKTRCYVHISPPSEQYRLPGEVQIETRMIEKVELSDDTISRCESFDRNTHKIRSLYSLGIIGGAIPALLPPITGLFLINIASADLLLPLVFLGFYIGLPITMFISMFMLYKFTWARVRVQKLYSAGRPWEIREITDGENQFVDLVENGATIERQIPVESIAASLGHESSKVRQRAAEYIKLLPKSIRSRIRDELGETSKFSTAIDF